MKENRYIRKRLFKSKIQSIPFYLFRLFPIEQRKVVFTCIEGTVGFSCNPKYIALELIKQNAQLPLNKKWKLVWLIDDISKSFPKEILVKKNTLLNRAFALTTAKFWIDNSRKQLEVRKRNNQIYIQTWHAKLGFKPTCLDRGASFTRIAYLVSKHDSDMIDYWLSNSDWYDKTLPTGSLYEGKTLRTGSPRCDILISGRDDAGRSVRQRFNLETGAKILMYAPTFRGGNQNQERGIEVGDHFPDYEKLLCSLEKRFGGEWYILLRLHPQLVARGLDRKMGTGEEKRIIDGSRIDDMYELLAGCDAFLTDYSSAAFDAAIMDIPVLLFCDDYKEYEDERGKLLWDMRSLPFPLAENNEELLNNIIEFDEKKYQTARVKLLSELGVKEDGNASKEVVNFILNTNKGH